MDFIDGLKLVLELEGGKVDHPADPGGRTNMGITQSVYDSYREFNRQPPRDVFDIDMSEVEGIYGENYWRAAGCNKLPGRLAVAHFQAAVVLGPGTARKILEATEWDDAFEDLRVYAYLTLQREKFKRIVAQNPKSQVFLGGWLNRVAKTWKFVRRPT